MSVNKVIIVGRLGQDAELRHTQANFPVCNFSLATSETWLDKQGQKQEKTEWHKIVTYGKIAEICGKYLKKGKQVYVEGKLQTREWKDKEGHTRYTTEIQGMSVQFLGDRPQDSGVQPGPLATASQAVSSPAPAPQTSNGNFGDFQSQFQDSGVPF